jgi:hypothetical protein
MSSRISIARPSSINADPHGLSNSRASTGYRSANPDDPLEKIRMFGKQVEDQIEIISQPLKPNLPALGRFLIVVTFLEDALRIMTQWGDQLWYLQQCVFGQTMCFAWRQSTNRPGHRRHRHFPWGISHLFLAINVVVRAPSSALILKWADRSMSDHARGLCSRHLETSHGIRCRRSSRRSNHSRIRLRAHLRSHLLPPQPECDRRTRDGV